MNCPFKIKDKVYSTDAHILAIVDEFYVGEKYNAGPEKLCSNVLNVIPKEVNQNLVLSVADVKEALDRAPLEDDYDWIGEDIECSLCRGEGLVEWEFDGHYKEDDCPVCDGSGYSSTQRKLLN